MSKNKVKNKHGRKGAKNKGPKKVKPTSSESPDVIGNAHRALQDALDHERAAVSRYRAALIEITEVTKDSRWKEAKAASAIAQEALA